VDRTQLDLALFNLALNARDAMPGGVGTLRVEAAPAEVAGPGDPRGLRPGRYLRLTVADDGTGMDAATLARATEPFFTTKEVGQGTGLGLSQVYGFAKQSGGTATIASEPGRGTTVTLYLLRTAEAVAAADETHPSEPAPRREPRGRVLLVEDNGDVAEIARGRLEEFGYEVVHAPDVASARSMLRQADGGIDLVFSDIVMPGDWNGLDLARAVRQDYGGQVPVLLATGYSDVAQSAADEGFPILRKPYGEAELHEAVAKAIRPARLKVMA
jgi:two-component system, NtrC family, sensor kinase